MKTFRCDNQNSSLLTQTEVNNPLQKKGRVYSLPHFYEGTKPLSTFHRQYTIELFEDCYESLRAN